MTQKKILVVDDEQDVRIYLSRIFQESGYVVTCATDGEEALKMLEAERPDLITLDLSMPNKSGVRFYREIKGRPEFSGIPVVFVTGVTGPGGAADTQRFYATRHQVPPPDGFVAKPVDPAEIAAVVGKLI